MRSTSIISVIRKYGSWSRKLRKSRINYEKALEVLMAYEHGDVKISKIVDNRWFPTHSIANHCQLEGCGMPIRWEYVVSNKDDESNFQVVGSTCVWKLLEMSELEIKDFKRYENTLKDFHDMLEWKEENLDVWAKLKMLRDCGIRYYKPFWEEVEFCRLHPDDEAFIRGLDVDGILLAEENRKKADEERAENLKKRLENEKTGNAAVVINIPNKKNKEEISGCNDEMYEKLLECLEQAAEYYKDSEMLNSIKMWTGKSVLTEKQLMVVKSMYNKMVFDKNVKGTKHDRLETCESEIQDFLKNALDSKSLKVWSLDETNFGKSTLVYFSKKYRKKIKQLAVGDVRDAWNSFRVKYWILND